MDVKKLLMAFFLLFALTSQVYATGGDVDELCKTVDSLNTAGGCLDSDDIQDAVTSAGSVFTMEFIGLAGLVVLAVIASVFLGIKFLQRRV